MWHKPINKSEFLEFHQIFSLNSLLLKANDIPYCVNVTEIPCPSASHSTMNALPKVGATDVGVEDMASIKRENAKVASSFHINDIFFKRYVSGLEMHA